MNLTTSSQDCRASRGGPQVGCLLGNQTRDFVADFLTGFLRRSELGSVTNEKTQAFGPGFVYLVEVIERRSNKY
jgi:hypothetical protein